MQQDFLDNGAAEIPGTSAVVPRIAALLAVFRKARRPVVHVVRIYQADGSNVDLCRRASIESGRGIVRPGSRGLELAAGLGVNPERGLDPDLLLGGRLQSLGPDECAMYKPRWGAFYQTPLETYLRSRGV